MNSPESIRAEQVEYARTQLRGTTLHRPNKPFTPKSAGSKPTGHEAFLKALEASGAVVQIEKASSGDIVVGKIKASDKYTVSLRCPVVADDWEGPYKTRVIFKHDISEFSPLLPAAQSAGAAITAPTSAELH